MKNFTITSAKGETHLRQILALQQRNLARNLDPEQVKKDGFVTVEHNLEILQKMNEAEPQIIAISEEVVVAYALLMLEKFRHDIPILEPMFQKIATLSYQGKSLLEYRYIAMGQICVDEQFRGMGVFPALYKGIKENTSGRYDLCITEVALRNTRSMRAHSKVGFETLLEYQDETDVWALIAWDLR
jgi:hypothetical protein